MYAKLRVLCGLLAMLIVTISLTTIVLPSSPAKAAGCLYWNYFPTQGAAKTVGPTSSGLYGARLEFKLSQYQIDNLKCFASHLEIDFEISGFSLPDDWDDYVVSSNLPGAAHDVAISDEDSHVPAVTGIQTGRLEAEKTYYATIWWSAKANQAVPNLVINWIPSYWAVNGPNAYESFLCHTFGFQPGWCVFGYGAYAYRLSTTWFHRWLTFTSSVQTYPYGSWGFLPAPTTGDMPELNAYITSPPSTAPTPPPPPSIKQVQRTTGPDGARQVYAATKSAVTEASWQPDGDGPKTYEIIHISQDNIVDFAKVNEPGGVRQSLYTAVPDGVWETYWGPDSVLHHSKIVTGLSGVRQVVAAGRQESAGYTHRLYVLADDGPYEIWWRDGDQQNPGVHVNRLDSIAGPVTMVKSTGPGGEDQLYVATPTYVYELWWRPNESVHHSALVNITQGNIVGLSKAANSPDGKQRVYTTTSTGVWESSWGGGAGLSHRNIVVNQINVVRAIASSYNGVDELYVATRDHVQEYWSNGSGGSSGNSELVRISQNNITSFDKSNDGNFQQVYTASGDLVYETYWGGGQGPTSKVLFSVAR